MMVAVALMTAVSVNAQCEDLKNEVSLSYGFGSLSQFGDGLGEGLGLVFSNTERGFAELGVGEQGFAQAGIRYKF